ncbi:AAA family ATPase [Candidatus Merdisoma sp. JLR.KK006]|uniref:ATP-binding protein n=1 Tax=Candidatus Merdisoma sp. JLR.KK006 TaxID=3112626 RepID=UPI002FF222E7
MLEWKREFDGKTALLIKGARRVGKSTLVEEFAKNEYESYILIDFSIASKEVNTLFSDLSDLNYLFLRLQMIYHVNLVERKSVIIFDEVQMQPMARQAIKHLVKDHRYDYIETGSLLSIKKNIKDIVIPSEETRLQLFPLDYEEFRWALGDTVTLPLLLNTYKKMQPLGDDINRRLLRDFRLYMLVGGMPQAVDTYIETNNLNIVDQVKRNILELYEDDFRKIDSSGRAGMLFDAIPAELNKNASRYQVSSVIAGEKEERVREILADMQDSMTVYISYHADDPGAGMSLHKDPRRYKLFLCDTGLFATLAFKDRDFTENEIYEKLLNHKLGTDLGYLYENMVAQMLKTAGNELFYYTFPKETSNHNYEIDFLLARKNKICPLEVKSSGYKSHASLDAFQNKFSSRILNRYLIYTKDVRKDKDIFCLPIYMVPFL